MLQLLLGVFVLVISCGSAFAVTPVCTMPQNPLITFAGSNASNSLKYVKTNRSVGDVLGTTTQSIQVHCKGDPGTSLRLKINKVLGQAGGGGGVAGGVCQVHRPAYYWSGEYDGTSLFEH
jgi:hypothetical protein